MRLMCLLVSLVGSLVSMPAAADDTIRFATYNIEWFTSEDITCYDTAFKDVRKQGNRLSRLREVIAALDADVVGLQEIHDRTALELIFPAPDWTIVFDDETAECQNLALAVRAPLTVNGAESGALNAGPEHFLYPGEPDYFFPGSRNVLAVEVNVPGQKKPVVVLVHHAKSRSGGRFSTAPRRIGASQLIVDAVRSRFAGLPLAILGDMNDSPDDASVNILETGNPNAEFEIEDRQGPFLINVTEPLFAAGHVTYGRTPSDISGGEVNTIDGQSRERNATHKRDDTHTGDMMLDQILVSPDLFLTYVPGSARVLYIPAVVEGGDAEAPSDHLPVFADFVPGLEVSLETIFSEDFEDGSLGELRSVSVASNQDWEHYVHSGNGFARMNGYQADVASEDWLITPALDLSEYESVTLRFDSAYNFDGPPLECFVSVNYKPSAHVNPNDAEWETLDPSWPSTGNYTFMSSGPLDLSPYAGQTVYVAWRYTSTGVGPGEGRMWEVDNIQVFEGAAAAAAGQNAAHEDLAPTPIGDFRVATFNASLYRNAAGELMKDLVSGNDKQIQNIAETIQRVRPDVVLINEFDYVPDGAAARLFQEHYLGVPQGGAEPIVYPHHFVAPSNTGADSGFDLNNNGKKGEPEDALGFGRFEGQYGMLLLSKFPIKQEAVRTFQDFRWQDLPGAVIPEGYFAEDALKTLPLSSKSHWDVPVDVNGTTVHLLCSHPTPPVFDGPEDRNGRRNHDEIRFWTDYVTPEKAAYIYDDRGRRGGLAKDARFVVLGDLNADPDRGDSRRDAILSLISAPALASCDPPVSRGAATHGKSPRDTSSFGLRVDYVLPSRFGFSVEQAGVFWPDSQSPLHRLVGGDASSDHRMVWLDLSIQ